MVPPLSQITIQVMAVSVAFELSSLVIMNSGYMSIKLICDVWSSDESMLISPVFGLFDAQYVSEMNQTWLISKVFSLSMQRDIMHNVCSWDEVAMR